MRVALELCRKACRTAALGLVTTGVLHASYATAQEAAPTIDAASGLKVAKGWEVARGHCGACHSYRLVTANRGDRDYWLNTLRWMQKTQNLWQIPQDQENQLLDYLADNYNESDWGRRPPLSPGLMPE